MAALERKVHRDSANCTNVREVTVVTVVTILIVVKFCNMYFTSFKLG